MKALIWHCKKFNMGNSKPTKKFNCVDFEITNIFEKNVLAIFISIENIGDTAYFFDLLSDLKKLSLRFDTNKIIIIPFVHFITKIPPIKEAFEVINKFYAFLAYEGYVVKKAHFGSSKDIELMSPSDPFQVVFRSYPSEVNFKSKKN